MPVKIDYYMVWLSYMGGASSSGIAFALRIKRGENGTTYNNKLSPVSTFRAEARKINIIKNRIISYIAIIIQN